MDVRHYITAFRRRAVLIVVIVALGLGLGFGYASVKTPVYTATAQVLINPPPGAATQKSNSGFNIGDEAQLVKSAAIAASAAKVLATTQPSTDLLKHVSVKTSPTSFIMAISYWHTDPAHAALGANAFARAYLDYKLNQTETQIFQQQASLNKQISQLRTQQAAQNAALQSSVRGSIPYLTAQDALNQLKVKLAVLAQSLAGLPTIVNPGQIILPATTPSKPSSPKVPLDVAAGLFVGLLCGFGLAFVLDRMDDRVHEGADLQWYVDVPLLASIPHVKGRHRLRAVQLVVHLEPRSPVAEAYRTIRTSVLSMSGRRDLKVVAFASPVQGEGKSMTCANVAAALGQTDKRVLVLSADIRKPTIHEFFFASREPGLSEVLQGKISFDEAVEKTEVGNVWVLSGGAFPTNPAELLQSSEMVSLLDAVREAFDFVIVDCPPILGLADCLAVLPLVDAVLLVVQAGETRGGALIEASERLERVGVSVDATIINDVKVRRGQPGHGAYGYYVASLDHLRPDGPELAAAPRPARGPKVTAITDADAASRDADGPKRTEAVRWGSAATASSSPNGAAPVSKRPEPLSSSADEL
jgi:capsular exopolysaccharide synthesis family protein